MASRCISVPSVLLALILLVSCSAAFAQNKCDGLPAGAKLRYQWMYALTSPTPANLKLMDAAVQKWMKEDCSSALAYGQGPSIGTSPASFGITKVLPTMSFADYAAWSDWASIDGLKSCYEKGLKSGNVQAIRKFSKSATRLVIALQPNKGSTTTACPSATSSAPATVRYMFTYVLAKPGPDTCKSATSLQATIATNAGMFVRHGDGCDVVADDSKVYAPTVTNTADYGGFIDFKSPEDMLAYLSNKSSNVADARTSLRSLAATSMRGAVVLISSPTTAATAMAPKANGRRLKQE